MFKIFNVEASFLESAISRSRFVMAAIVCNDRRQHENISDPSCEPFPNEQINTIQYMVIPDPCSSHSRCFSLALLSTALNSAQRRRRIMSNVDKDLDYMISPQEFYTLLSQKFEKDDPKEETRRRTDAYDFAVDFFGN